MKGYLKVLKLKKFEKKNIKSTGIVCNSRQYQDSDKQAGSRSATLLFSCLERGIILMDCWDSNGNYIVN